MNTPTHLLIASGLLARRHAPARNWAAALGGFGPDVPMFALFGWHKLVEGRSEAEIFGDLYWTDLWQVPIAVTHSIPLALAALAVGLWRRIEWLWVAAAAVLLHIAGDLPFHHDDAHAHFWPLSMWKYHSPVSYWDPAHYGDLMRLVELAIVLAMAGLLWWRFQRLWVRALLGLAVAGFLAPHLYFGYLAASP